MWEKDPTHGRTRGGMVETYATIAGFLTLAAAFGANSLSQMAEKGESPIMGFFHPDQGMKRLAKAAPAAQPGQPALARRSPGIDSTSTATIPTRSGESPAGASRQPVTVIRSVGVDGEITAPVPVQLPAPAPAPVNPCGEGRAPQP
jgi:hypothetical protein